MTPVCTCKRPDVEGEGEQQHCVKCGAWTQSAINANYERKRREAALRAPSTQREDK